MHKYLSDRRYKTLLTLICVSLLLFLSACQNGAGQSAANATPSPRATSQQGAQIASQKATPTPSPTLEPTPAQAANNPAQVPSSSNSNETRPVLAFYYSWYTPSSWSLSTMSDLPTIQYNSSDDATISRQVTWAANSGITGFISSWWGPGDVTDKNFAKLLAYAATLQSTTGYQFDSTIYFESDAPALSGTNAMINALRYVISQYSHNQNFFHWHGKPVIFFWDPLGNGRTLSTWTYIRSQVDPNDSTIWSAEGTNVSLLGVFDGLHLFSAAYWGIQNGDITAVDQGFRAKIDAYNLANHTQKIWAAGVLPGYNDTRVPGRTGTYIVPRNNGATYHESWAGAIASNPDWITITTFNEWFEGAMIEPSVTYGNLYLDLTQQLIKQWRG